MPGQLRGWEAVKSKLYRIGQEERFKTRMQELWDYCEDKMSKYKRSVNFKWRGLKMRLEIDKNVWKNSSKSEGMVWNDARNPRPKKKSRSYYYIRIWEVENRDGEEGELILIRMDDRGFKSELLWLGRGKKVSGKQCGKFANVIYKALKPKSAFLHDDAHISFKCAGGPAVDAIRSKKASVRKQRLSKKKKAKKLRRLNKKMKRTGQKTQSVSLRLARTMMKGTGWYESLGFKPVKRTGHTFYKESAIYNQHPAQYKAAVEFVRKTTVKDFMAMCKKSTVDGRSRLADAGQDICDQVADGRTNITLSTVCCRVMKGISKKPNSLKAQRLLAKFNNTFMVDHEDRFQKKYATRKLHKYYDRLNVIDITMLFVKQRADLE